MREARRGAMLSYVLSCVLCCPSTPCNIYVAFSIPLFILCVCVCVYTVCVCVHCVWCGMGGRPRRRPPLSSPTQSCRLSSRSWSACSSSSMASAAKREGGWGERGAECRVQSSGRIIAGVTDRQGDHVTFLGKDDDSWQVRCLLVAAVWSFHISL